MLRSAIRTVREPRYAKLALLMLLVALVCVAAGTWQISRFEGKIRANDALRANAHAAAVPVTTLLPLVGAPAPSSDSVQYRPVTATGSYDVSAQTLVDGRTVDGRDGYLVVTPLRTATAILLVNRGFVVQSAQGGPPQQIAAPPPGQVTVTGRALSGEAVGDGGGAHADVVHSINPGDQQQRLGRPVLDGFMELTARQPGQRGLVAMGEPDLSNPAGGAVEPQHFAYIVQWYLFALLALAAPFAMARADRNDRSRSTELDEIDGPAITGPRSARAAARRAAVTSAPDTSGATAIATSALTAEGRRAAKLADRYS